MCGGGGGGVALWLRMRKISLSRRRQPKEDSNSVISSFIGIKPWKTTRESNWEYVSLTGNEFVCFRCTQCNIRSSYDSVTYLTGLII